MKLIDKAIAEKLRLFGANYTKSDIIKNMCPVELGLADIECSSENGSEGYEACRKCWNREYPEQ